MAENPHDATKNPEANEPRQPNPYRSVPRGRLFSLQECSHKRVIENGERVCANCGLVLGPVLSSAPCRNPDREYGESFYQHRWDLASASYRHDRGLGTELRSIDMKTKISPGVREWWNRMLHNPRGASYRERRLRELFCEVIKVCGYMGLPHAVRVRMCWMLRKLVGKKRGPVLGLMADLVYIACRSLGYPRTLDEIDQAFRELYGRSYTPLRGKRIGRIHELARKFGYNLLTPTAHDYIDRLAERWGAPQVAASAHRIAQELNSSNPVARAKLAVRLAAKEARISLSPHT